MPTDSTTNICKFERYLRIALGLAMLVLIFVGPKPAWGIFGLLPLSTGLVGWCPIYAIFGVSTCFTCPRKGS